MTFESLRTIMDDVRIADPPTSATGALAIMDARQCDHVAITARGRLMGVLSRYDLAVWIIRKQREQLDCAIRAVKRVG